MKPVEPILEEVRPPQDDIAARVAHPVTPGEVDLSHDRRGLRDDRGRLRRGLGGRGGRLGVLAASLAATGPP